MSKKGKFTRKRIIDESRELIYSNGFAGTTIDQIIAHTGITKGSFFYHFTSKADLSKAILEDYISQDHALMDQMVETAGSITDDPLERLLEFIQLTIIYLSDQEAAPDACLYASYTYSPDQFDEEVKVNIAQALEENCKKMEGMIEDILKHYKLAKGIDPGDLKYTYETIIQGGFIIGRITGSHSILKNQLLLLKEYLKRIFVPR